MQKKGKKAHSDKKRIIGWRESQLSSPSNIITTQIKATSRHLPQALHDIGNGEARLRYLPRFLHDRIGRACLKLAQLVRVIAELSEILPALLHRVGREVVFADSDNARDDRYDLCNILAKVRWRGWTADTVDDVLDCHYDGVGLCLKVRLERPERSAVRDVVDNAEMRHL